MATGTYSVLVHLAGPKILTKEVLQFAGNLYFLIWGDNIERMEFGSLGVDDKVYGMKMGAGNSELSIYTLFEMTENDNALAKKFINGDCVGLLRKYAGYPGKDDSFLCEACLMHQYGLHRTKDKIKGNCFLFPIN